jgi:cytochrome c oxidase assembly protein subunit 15
MPVIQSQGPAQSRNSALPASAAHIWPSWLAWSALVLNVAVVLWGAYVRQSQSGAGCGSRWPLCNGVIVPHGARWHTVVEFTHRASSGVAVVMVAAVAIVAFATTPRRNLARWAAGFAALFMFNEALLGALLVLLKKVAMDQSVGRAVYLCTHSANTLLLLAALACCAYWLTWPEDAGWSKYKHGPWWPPLLALLLTLTAAATGAIAALGDTLFPATSLHQAWAQDFASNAHYALRLRILHPLSATLLAVYVLWMVLKRAQLDQGPRHLALLTLGLLVLQYALGIADIFLLAPLWLQIVHLFGADIFWIALVLLIARSQPRLAAARIA